MTMQHGNEQRGNESPANDPNSVWQRRAYGNRGTVREGSGGYRSYVNVYTMLKSSGQTEEMVTNELKTLGCLDSGCNEYAVFNDPSYFPFDLTADHDVRMKVYNV